MSCRERPHVDQQSAAVAGALVRITSPALIGGALATTTNERGQLRFPSLPPGAYVLEIELQGFGAYREANIRLGGGATIERPPILAPAGVAEYIVVDGAGSRIDARNPGFATRFGAQDLDAIPTRRFSIVRATGHLRPGSERSHQRPRPPANDRPHMLRVMSAVDVPRTAVVVAANLQHLSGKPWAKTALINPNEPVRPVLIESRGSERLSSQTLLDFRVSRAFGVGALGRVELRFDVLNALNDTAEESIRSEVYNAATLGQANIFIDPRRDAQCEPQSGPLAKAFTFSRLCPAS